ncbi:MAG TPA: hypothetical protein VGR57_00045 [Ktedonobacterales bacterium]|nr:hypothetical protein [Ktedonobacterales bacterium]
MSRSPSRSRRRRLSLSLRLSLLVLCAALLPLAAVVGFTNAQARDKLIAQSQRSLATDAAGKNQIIYNYMKERLLDGGALATLPTAQDYLACHDPSMMPQGFKPFMLVLQGVMRCNVTDYNKLSSQRALEVGILRDTNYTMWSMYDLGANRLLSTSTLDATPLADSDQAALKQGNYYISDVRYDDKTGSAFVYIYAPIKLSMKGLADALQFAAAQGQVTLPDFQVSQIVKAVQNAPDQTVGYLQAQLNLDSVWSVVANEQNANGPGSYAFILDQNGVRVADSYAAERFTKVTAQSLPVVANALTSTTAPATFQSIATADSKTLYQYVRVRVNDAAKKGEEIPLGWTYFVLSPLPTVTQVADDQVRVSLAAAAVVAILAGLLGLLLGRGLASPVQASVADLRGATEALNTLASRQRNSASEQLWVVDACKTGLESVRYLSDAMHQAASRIVEAGNWFDQYWDRLTEEQAQRTVQHLRELAQYIEEASRRQWASSERLDKAITVTTQVSDQLAHGASAAAESAEQLDIVVDQLQRVVGGPAHSRSHAGYASEEPEPDMRAQDGHMGFPAEPAARPMMPAGPQQRQLPSGRMPGNSGGQWSANGGYNGQGGAQPVAPNGGFGAWPEQAPSSDWGARNWGDR